MSILRTGVSSLTESTLVISLSAGGIVSDATNGVDYGAVAPAGATGQEVAINALIAATVAKALALGVPGVKVIWDVAVAIGAPLYFYSNMIVDASPGCGAIVRVNALCPVWRPHGTETAPASNNGTDSQNAFGKIDPVHGVDYRYRVFDPTFVNVRNFKLLGGIWNANSLQQPAVGGNGNNQITTRYGFVSTIQLWGVENVVVRDASIFLPPGFAVHLINYRNVVFENCDLDVHVQTFQDSNTYQTQGPGSGLTIRGGRVHAPDDLFAINADDIATLAPASGSLIAGVNWPCSGPITNVLIENVEAWNGRENTVPFGMVRILSNFARVDNVTIRRISGLTSRWSCLFETIGGVALLGDGPGNVGRVVVDECSFDLQSGTGTSGRATIQINYAMDCLDIRNRYRYDAQAFPDVVVEAGANIQILRVGGTWFSSINGTQNVPVVQIDGGTVHLLQGRGTIHRDLGLSIAAAPFVKVNAGVCATVDLDIDAERITNVIDIQGGTVTTVLMRGSHRDAGGGSPVNHASPNALQSYLYVGMAYEHTTITASSGSGAISHLADYNESAVAAVATSYTTSVSATTISSGSSVSVKFTPVGGNWPTGETITPTQSGVTGAFTSATISPAGAAAISVVWTATSPNTGTAVFNSTTSPVLTNTTGGVSCTVTAAVASVYLLDKTSLAVANASSFARKLRASYAGPAYDVRYSNGHAAESIGFLSNGIVDTTTLLASAGTGDAFVTKVYDQSPLGNHAVTNPGYQPHVVTAGVLVSANGKPSCNFNGGGLFAPTGVISDKLSVFMVVRNAGPARTDRRMVTISSTGSTTDYISATNALIIHTDSTSGATLDTYRGGSSYGSMSASITALFTVSTIFTGAAVNMSVDGGVAHTAASSGAFGAGQWNIGCGINGDPGTPFQAHTDLISEWVFYTTDASADISVVHTDHKSFYATA